MNSIEGHKGRIVLHLSEPNIFGSAGTAENKFEKENFPVNSVWRDKDLQNGACVLMIFCIVSILLINNR